MEILLLQDIVGVGKKNDLIQVGDGFALNCLLPKRAALVATPLVRRRYAELIRRRAEEREHEKSVQVGNAKAIAGKTVTFVRKASKTGKLYAGVTEAMIAQVLKDQHGIVLMVSAIQLPEHIKSVGSYVVPVQLAGQSVTITVTVQAEVAKQKVAA
ncbi:MAG TPA: 50S ribosomal protein L9 [Candidatus Peribacteraceae bacterium]|nr:50S ribosomal protein L9 [Candidatus Peribacteraceae bacterium]